MCTGWGSCVLAPAPLAIATVCWRSVHAAHTIHALATVSRLARPPSLRPSCASRPAANGSSHLAALRAALIQQCLGVLAACRGPRIARWWQMRVRHGARAAEGYRGGAGGADQAADRPRRISSVPSHRSNPASPRVQLLRCCDRCTTASAHGDADAARSVAVGRSHTRARAHVRHRARPPHTPSCARAPSCCRPRAPAPWGFTVPLPELATHSVPRVPRQRPPPCRRWHAPVRVRRNAGRHMHAARG